VFVADSVVDPFVSVVVICAARVEAVSVIVPVSADTGTMATRKITSLVVPESVPDIWLVAAVDPDSVVVPFASVVVICETSVPVSDVVAASVTDKRMAAVSDVVPESEDATGTLMEDVSVAVPASTDDCVMAPSSASVPASAEDTCATGAADSLVVLLASVAEIGTVIAEDSLVDPLSADESAIVAASISGPVGSRSVS
jgi:hypothetical protein